MLLIALKSSVCANGGFRIGGFKPPIETTDMKRLCAQSMVWFDITNFSFNQHYRTEWKGNKVIHSWYCN
jgi:hypothetical protein